MYGHQHAGMKHPKRISRRWAPGGALCAGLVAWAWVGAVPAALPVLDGCTCSVARIRQGWCPACKVGYIAGFRLQSYDLWETLDAHGHDFDGPSIRCAACQQAMKTDGFCDACGMGYLHNLAYLSRLTYHLARGRICDVEGIACHACRQNAQRYGWCGACRRGMVGHVCFVDRSDYDGAAHQMEIVFRAQETIPRCETCAVAMVSNGRCPYCKITYRDGEPLERKPP